MDGQRRGQADAPEEVLLLITSFAAPARAGSAESAGYASAQTAPAGAGSAARFRTVARFVTSLIIDLGPKWWSWQPFGAKIDDHAQSINGLATFGTRQSRHSRRL